MTKTWLKKLCGTVALMLCAIALMGASGCRNETSDDVQQAQGEKILMEATTKTGMPGIVNFRERKLLKTILEMRDQADFVTWTYLENMNPVIVPGHTALGGKLTFLGQSIGYPLPYATQYTNPMKPLNPEYSHSTTIPQADPNGLFSPASAEGTWILLKDPNGTETKPVYVEPRVICLPHQLPLDK